MQSSLGQNCPSSDLAKSLAKCFYKENKFTAKKKENRKEERKGRKKGREGERDGRGYSVIQFKKSFLKDTGFI